MINRKGHHTSLKTLNPQEIQTTRHPCDPQPGRLTRSLRRRKDVSTTGNNTEYCWTNKNKICMLYKNVLLTIQMYCKICVRIKRVSLKKRLVLFYFHKLSDTHLRNLVYLLGATTLAPLSSIDEFDKLKKLEPGPHPTHPSFAARSLSNLIFPSDGFLVIASTSTLRWKKPYLEFFLHPKASIFFHRIVGKMAFMTSSCFHFSLVYRNYEIWSLLFPYYTY